MLFKRLKAARARSRRFQPAVGGVEGLESRALLHAAPVAAHAAAVVRAAAHPAAHRVAPAAGVAPVETIHTPNATILLPTNLVPGQTYPLVVAFAYNGVPGVPFQVWRGLAARNDWIVYGSQEYTNPVLRNGVGPSDKVASDIVDQVNALATTLPVDRSRIILTGMSGAANFAEFMNLRYPGYAAGVIANSGRIPSQLFRATPTPGFLTIPSASDFAGSRELAVFLASPSDTMFYDDSRSNAELMRSLGWDVLFLNFAGGHRNAPPGTYQQAIDWMESQPSWTGNPT